jgi:tRNA A-37 threonylcarbamoyl transferase component Bud32/DNA-directed RNA polymerase specialized sigma24 family protein
MCESSSENLLKRYLDGSDTAPFELHNRYANRLIALARNQLLKTLQSKIGPEDVAQEAFKTFFELADSKSIKWQVQGDLWRFLAGIAINKVRQQHEVFSTKKRRVHSEIELDEKYLADTKFDALSVSALNELVDDLLVSEKPLLRKVVQLKLAGFSTTEIGIEIGRSSRTIRRLLDSLRAKLANQNDFGFSEMFAVTNVDTAIEREFGPDKFGELDYNDYQLLQMIGQGSFAKVYLARENSTGALYALKAVRKKWLKNTQVRNSFYREARILTQIKNTHIAKAFGLGELPNGGCFLLLELIEGQTLKEACEHASKNQVEEWIADLQAAVRSIHSQGVVHGDLRPSNLLIDGDIGIRILDFGLGRKVEDTNGSGISSDIKALNSIVDELNAKLK